MPGLDWGADVRTQTIRPVLAQFSAAASRGNALPSDTYVDSRDSMLRKSGSEQPLIEAVLRGGDTHEMAISTVITATRIDPIDPDSIRVAADQFVTLITRSEDEPSDPDVIRLDADGAFSTMFTKADVDPSDPDAVRMHG